MSKKFRDRTGEVYEHYTVIGLAEKKISPTNGKAYYIWNCRCECGNEFRSYGLNIGRNVVSCGCVSDRQRAEKLAQRWADYKAGKIPWPGRKDRPPRKK